MCSLVGAFSDASGIRKQRWDSATTAITVMLVLQNKDRTQKTAISVLLHKLNLIFLLHQKSECLSAFILELLLLGEGRGTAGLLLL